MKVPRLISEPKCGSAGVDRGHSVSTIGATEVGDVAGETWEYHWGFTGFDVKDDRMLLADGELQAELSRLGLLGWKLAGIHPRTIPQQGEPAVYIFQRRRK